MSKPELKRGYSVRLGSGQPEFDSLQFRLRHIFFLLKHLPDIQECSMIVVQREANVKLDNVKIDNVKIDNVKILWKVNKNN